MLDIQRIIINIFVWAVPVLFAITVHEVAHGWAANKLGDTTAKMLGRLTLNPIKHTDPIGTVALPIAILLLTKFQFAFGWAKPVPVTYQNLRQPKRDMALVAMAGPVANLIMAILWALIAKLALFAPSQLAGILFSMGAGIIINLWLMVLNLLPLPPLDGSRVVSAFLTDKASYAYNRLERFGFIILIVLLLTGILGRFLYPVMLFFLNALASLFGLNALASLFGLNALASLFGLPTGG